MSLMHYQTYHQKTMSWQTDFLCTIWLSIRVKWASDKVYQLLAHGQWFSPASSTTKTGRHDTAEDKYHLSNCFMIMTSYYN